MQIYPTEFFISINYSTNYKNIEHNHKKTFITTILTVKN